MSGEYGKSMNGLNIWEIYEGVWKVFSFIPIEGLL